MTRLMSKICPAVTVQALLLLLHLAVCSHFYTTPAKNTDSPDSGLVHSKVNRHSRAAGQKRNSEIKKKVPGRQAALPVTDELERNDYVTQTENVADFQQAAQRIHRATGVAFRDRGVVGDNKHMTYHFLKTIYENKQPQVGDRKRVCDSKSKTIKETDVLQFESDNIKYSAKSSVSDEKPYGISGTNDVTDKRQSNLTMGRNDVEGKNSNAYPSRISRKREIQSLHRKSHRATSWYSESGDYLEIPQKRVTLESDETSTGSENDLIYIKAWAMVRTIASARTPALDRHKQPERVVSARRQWRNDKNVNRQQLHRHLFGSYGKHENGRVPITITTFVSFHAPKQSQADILSRDNEHSGQMWTQKTNISKTTRKKSFFVDGNKNIESQNRVEEKDEVPGIRQIIPATVPRPRSLSVSGQHHDGQSQVVTTDKFPSSARVDKHRSILIINRGPDWLRSKQKLTNNFMLKTPFAESGFKVEGIPNKHTHRASDIGTGLNMTLHKGPARSEINFIQSVSFMRKKNLKNRSELIKEKQGHRAYIFGGMGGSTRLKIRKKIRPTDLGISQDLTTSGSGDGRGNGIEDTDDNRKGHRAGDVSYGQSSGKFSSLLDLNIKKFHQDRNGKGDTGLVDSEITIHSSTQPPAYPTSNPVVNDREFDKERDDTGYDVGHRVRNISSFLNPASPKCMFPNITRNVNSDEITSESLKDSSERVQIKLSTFHLPWTETTIAFKTSILRRGMAKDNHEYVQTPSPSYKGTSRHRVLSHLIRREVKQNGRDTPPPWRTRSANITYDVTSPGTTKFTERQTSVQKTNQRVNNESPSVSAISSATSPTPKTSTKDYISSVPGPQYGRQTFFDFISKPDPSTPATGQNWFKTTAASPSKLTTYNIRRNTPDTNYSSAWYRSALAAYNCMHHRLPYDTHFPSLDYPVNLSSVTVKMSVSVKTPTKPFLFKDRAHIEKSSSSNADTSKLADYLVLVYNHTPTVEINSFVELANTSKMKNQHPFECFLRTTQKADHFVYGGWHRVTFDRQRPLVKCSSRSAGVKSPHPMNKKTGVQLEMFPYGVHSDVWIQSLGHKETSSQISYEFNPAVSVEGSGSDYLCIMADKSETVYVSDVIKVAHLAVTTGQPSPKYISSKLELEHNCIGLKWTKVYSIEWFFWPDSSSGDPRFDPFKERCWLPVANFTEWQGTAVWQGLPVTVLCRVTIRDDIAAASMGLAGVRRIERLYILVLQKSPISNAPSPPIMSTYDTFSALQNDALNLTCHLEFQHAQLNRKTQWMQFKLYMGNCSHASWRNEEGSYGHSYTQIFRVVDSRPRCVMCRFQHTELRVQIRVEPDLETALSSNCESPSRDLYQIWGRVTHLDTCTRAPQSDHGVLVHNGSLNCQELTCPRDKNTQEPVESKSHNKHVLIYTTPRQIKVCYPEREKGRDSQMNKGKIAAILGSLCVLLTLVAVAVVVGRRKNLFSKWFNARTGTKTSRIKSLFTVKNPNRNNSNVRTTTSEYNIPFSETIHPHEAIPASKIKFQECIGSGRFGNVYKAHLEGLFVGEGAGTGLAVKVITRNRHKCANKKKGASKEVNIIRSLPPHTHVIRYIGYSLTSQAHFIIMEFVTGGTLAEYIIKRRKRLSISKVCITPHTRHVFPKASSLLEQGYMASSGYSETSWYEEADGQNHYQNFGFEEDEGLGNGALNLLRAQLKHNRNPDRIKMEDLSGLCHDIECIKLSRDLCSMCLQVAMGMDHLVSLNIIHGDLRAQNVLVELTKSSPIAKICDFGTAHQLLQGERKYLPANPLSDFNLRWLAPETVKRNEFTFKSDVWAYGMTVWEAVSLGELPFADVSDDCLIQHILKGNTPDRPGICDMSIHSMVSECWRMQPEDRPSFSTLLQWWKNLHQGQAKGNEADDYENEPPIYCEIDVDEFVNEDTNV